MTQRDYQCVKAGEDWHLTQEQANPPHIHRGGAWTACTRWVEFRAGFERRRPTCIECLKHVQIDEVRR